APAIVLPSGAVVAARAPGADLPPVAAEAARELGGTVARAGTVVVQPSLDKAPDSLDSESGLLDICLCKPLKLDWSLTNVAAAQRMSFYTDDGTILSATDTPAASIRLHRERLWAAGVSVSMDMSQRRAAGLWVDRDVGRLRLGLELSQREGGAAAVRVGWRW